MKDVNIVFCTDKNYAKYLPPLIESILRNTTFKCNFYVVYSTINDEDKKKIIKTVTDFKDSTVDFVKFENIELLENNEISKYASSFRGGYDAFSRLFLTELLLSKNIKNCIYFDIDVVVKKNSDELFSLVKNIKFLAGVVDSVTIKNGGKWVYDKYINSGVLLMNLENLKSINFAEKCLDFIIEHGKETSLLDQDCINFVLGNKYIELIDQKYNEYLPKTQKVKDAVVLHFTGPFKPWMKETRWRLKKVFWVKYNFANNLRMKGIILNNSVISVLFNIVAALRPLMNIFVR
ncbi:glycosyltransferase [uncultured Succinatimonas sp.]|uniref:glycosyltransferase family 8 protein n=1 Tax=uncultured Succinatimonas sp. TaxID=1262973 RepID=UPI0025F47E81|nr:glycosyltransferase [uncultured Succinatimonas sp.]